MVSDLTPEERLRGEIANVICECEMPDGLSEPDGSHFAAADAVLRVVGERLTEDDLLLAIGYAVGNCDPGTIDADDLAQMRRAFSAAWRVVTGSNHE